MDKVSQTSNPLYIPEILFRVAFYLDTKDVLACSLVSKAFYSSFAPYVWGNLHIGLGTSQREALRHQDQFARFILPNPTQRFQEESLPQVLQRAAPWIRSLSIHEHYSARQLEFGENCTMLESLLIKGPPLDDKYDKTYWDKCKALVQQNSARLRSLTMICWNKSRGGRTLPAWTPVFDCTQHMNLCSLSVKGGSIGGERRKFYWQIFENLESLTLESIFVPPPSITNDNDTKSTTSQSNLPLTRLPKLRKLALNCLLGYDPLRHLEWLIRACPMLQTLEWTLGPRTCLPIEFVHRFVETAWPELDSITIKGDLNYVDHESYKSILQAAQRPFKVLDLNIQFLSPDMFNLLRQRHFKTLTNVDLSLATTTPHPVMVSTPSASQWVLEVLESCPLLEQLKARIITAQDIINGKPWACLGLKEFKVIIDMGFGRIKMERGAKRPEFTESEQSLCSAVFEQLGRLEQLRVLVLRTHYFPDMSTYFPLPLEVRLGLGQLSRLKDIKVIGFQGSQDLRMTDVEWMLQHWPYLAAIYGSQLSCKRSKTYGKEYLRNQLLASMLKSRGVRFWRYEGQVYIGPRMSISELYDTESESENEELAEDESENERMGE